MKAFKVLRADDEEDFVTGLSERMKPQDVGSDVALDGEQALKKVEEQKPDIIVLDLKMPGMHGLVVLDKVKKAYPDIGAFAFVRKPVALEQLIEVVTEAYRKKVELSVMASALAEADVPLDPSAAASSIARPRSTWISISSPITTPPTSIRR